jgi:hypothetical protein
MGRNALILAGAILIAGAGLNAQNLPLSRQQRADLTNDVKNAQSVGQGSHPASIWGYDLDVTSKKSVSDFIRLAGGWFDSHPYGNADIKAYLAVFSDLNRIFSFSSDMGTFRKTFNTKTGQDDIGYNEEYLAQLEKELQRTKSETLFVNTLLSQIVRESSGFAIRNANPETHAGKISDDAEDRIVTAEAGETCEVLSTADFLAWVKSNYPQFSVDSPLTVTNHMVAQVLQQRQVFLQHRSNIKQLFEEGFSHAFMDEITVLHRLGGIVPGTRLDIMNLAAYLKTQNLIPPNGDQAAGAEYSLWYRFAAGEVHAGYLPLPLINKIINGESLTKEENQQLDEGMKRLEEHLWAKVKLKIEQWTNKPIPEAPSQ